MNLLFEKHCEESDISKSALGGKTYTLLVSRSLT